eukprot:IDg21968t1
MRAPPVIKKAYCGLQIAPRTLLGVSATLRSRGCLCRVQPGSASPRRRPSEENRQPLYTAGVFSQISTTSIRLVVSAKSTSNLPQE